MWPLADLSIRDFDSVHAQPSFCRRVLAGYDTGETGDILRVFPLCLKQASELFIQEIAGVRPYRHHIFPFKEEPLCLKKEKVS